MQTSDYLDVLFVLGSLSVITKTRVTDYTFSVTGCIHANKPEKVIKLGLNWSSFVPLSGVVQFFVRMACRRATSIDSIFY